MSFEKTWLLPRIAFWVMWTAWLVCLQSILPHTPNTASRLLLVLGPPLLITWIGSRWVKLPFDTPSTLFWKGGAASCLLGLFANIFMIDSFDSGIEARLFVPLAAFALCGYMAVRGGGVKRIELKHGDLFARTQAIARQTGVSVGRLLIFTSRRNTPSAFAQRTGAILLSDPLLRLLSRQETDAVIAHEAAHLRPLQRTAMAAIPILAASTLIVRPFWPGVTPTAPFWPLLFVLLWRALRRMLEFDADANAIRTTCDPEALITALTRLSHASGLPLHWSRLAGLFIAHPPMTARFRALARRAGIGASRVEELMSTAVTIPALPGYESPFPPAAPDDSGILSIHRERLQMRMTFLSRGYPVIAGVAASAAALYWQPGFDPLLALAALWILGGIALYFAAYEVQVGWERRRLRNQLPDSRAPGSYFVGLSTAAEPRYFEGMYHYDLGMATISGGSLNFQGTRCSFSIPASGVRRVWLAKGPRHWTPRKIVCVEYENNIVSMQSLERWFWPGTSSASAQLLLAVTHWLQSAAPSDSPTVLPPQITGAIVPRLPMAAAWKAMKVSCAVSLAASWLISSMSPERFGGLMGPFLAPCITAALILFALAPHLERTAPSPPALPQPDYKKAGDS